VSASIECTRTDGSSRQGDSVDPLTHALLPLTVAYALRSDLFPDSRYPLLGVGLVAESDSVSYP